MRGLDNPTYYSLTRDFQNSWDNTGVGGNYNTLQPGRAEPDRRLAGLLARHAGRRRLPLRPRLGARQHLPARLLQLRQDGRGQRAEPHRAPSCRRGRPRGGTGIDLIAEPWAIGGNSYQVGSFPTGWSEWNGTFRDTRAPGAEQAGRRRPSPPARWRRASPARRDLYGDDGRKPWNSVNFMVAHDGFTLNDLYALQRQEQQPGLALRPIATAARTTTTAGTRAASPPPSARPRATASRLMMLSGRRADDDRRRRSACAP